MIEIPRWFCLELKDMKGIVTMLKLFSKIFSKLDEETLEELEENLIMADCGAIASLEIVAQLRKAAKEKKITEMQPAKEELRNIIEGMLATTHEPQTTEPLKIVLIIGVNGVGKTTSIGKLAHYYARQGKSVMLAAADTFRAAAAEQLTVWAERANCPIVKQEQGADPAAVVYDAIASAKAKNVDVLLVDTAGRLHNKQDLMGELDKIKRVIQKEATPETLLVLDATTGQNALSQAKSFGEITQINGIILTKLDGTSKGGIVIAIKKEQEIPVRYVGIGESVSDLREFDAKWFAEQLV